MRSRAAASAESGGPPAATARPSLGSFVSWAKALPTPSPASPARPAANISRRSMVFLLSEVMRASRSTVLFMSFPFERGDREGISAAGFQLCWPRSNRLGPESDCPDDPDRDARNEDEELRRGERRFRLSRRQIFQ